MIKKSYPVLTVIGNQYYVCGGVALFIFMKNKNVRPYYKRLDSTND